jgi:hypothetical protein
MVPSVKLRCVTVEHPARPEVMLTTVKEVMAGGPKPVMPAAVIFAASVLRVGMDLIPSMVVSVHSEEVW